MLAVEIRYKRAVPAPAAPGVRALPAPAGKFILQVQGQNGVPYQIQTSTNLVAWSSNTTVTLAGVTVNLTNAVSTGARYWRAVWLP